MQSFFIGDYDAVFIGDLVSIPYAQAIGLDRFPMIIDRGRVDSEFQRQQDAFASEQSLGLRIKRSVRLLTKRFERSANTLLSEQIVCAPSDKAALERVVGTRTPISVIANGITLDNSLIKALWQRTSPSCCLGPWITARISKAPNGLLITSGH